MVNHGTYIWGIFFSFFFFFGIVSLLALAQVSSRLCVLWRSHKIAQVPRSHSLSFLAPAVR